MKRPEWPQYRWSSWAKRPGWDRPQILYDWFDQDGRIVAAPEWARKSSPAGAGAEKDASDGGKAAGAGKGARNAPQGKLL